VNIAKTLEITARPPCNVSAPVCKTVIYLPQSELCCIIRDLCT